MRALLLIFVFGAMLPIHAETEAVKPAAQDPGLLSSLLTKAKTYIGTPYRYGGTTPKGFDCSGFVRFVFGSFGIDLQRSSVSQAKQGDAIDLGQIQPGDLLFFHTMGLQRRISHVGIYLGKGLFIHAGTWGGREKRGVKLGELASSYFANRLVSARRVITHLKVGAESPKDTPVIPFSTLGSGVERDQPQY